MSDKFQSDLLRGTLDLMVLSVLVTGKKYGYLIQRNLRESSNSRVDVQAGTLYPILHRLEADKLIRSSWDEETGRKRKWYELTSAGHKRLKSQAAEWQSYASVIEQILALASLGAKPA